MGICNYCQMKLWKADAKKQGFNIKKLLSTWGLGGQSVFMVPKNITLGMIRTWREPSDSLPDGDENWTKYCIGWMKEIPEHCCC